MHEFILKTIIIVQMLLIDICLNLMEEHCFRHDNFFYIKIFVMTKTTLILSNIYFIFLSL